MGLQQEVFRDKAMPDSVLPTVLLVEDEDADATLLCRGFEKIKILNRIVHLRNGDEALGYLAGVGPYGDRLQFPLPALILLDLNLPGLTGLQLLQWMRTRPAVRRIPVVVLTADEDPDTVGAAYDLGANSYLIKSAEPAHILRMVKAIQNYWLELNEAPHLIMGAAG